MAYLDPGDYWRDLQEYYARQVIELHARHFPQEDEWPEIVLEDILDAEYVTE